MVDKDNYMFPRKLYLENLVFVDGFGRSGKFMASPIIASLERVEHVQLSWLLEHIPVMFTMEQISEDAAVSLIQNEIENTFYATMIGRNVNFRFGDVTSIWHSKDPGLYLQRIQAEEGDFVYKKLEDEKPIMLFLTHDILCHGNIFFTALMNLKIIHIERHPIDVIASWYRKRTEGMIDNFRNRTLLIKGNQKKAVPWYVSGWEKRFENLKQVDRLIYSFEIVYNMRKKFIESVSSDIRKRILLLKFEEFTTNPEPILTKVCDFLDTTASPHTSRILVRERCPRPKEAGQRTKKLEVIQDQATTDAFKVLMNLCDEYEKNLQ